MTRLLFAPVLVASSLLLAAQQTRDAPTAPMTGTAQISGSVSTAETTPAPLRRAIVVITSDRATRLVAVTDDSGRFAFTSLPADRYTLSVSKAGYVPSNYGSKRAGGSGTPIVVADGQRTNVAISLVRGSVISGIVRDQSGRPLPDVTVTAQRYAISAQTGERALQSVTIGSAGAMLPNYAPDAFPGTARTDDRGEYRIFGLAPGEYIVSASARGVRSSLSGSDVHQTTVEDVQRAERLLRGASTGATSDPAASAGDRPDTSRVDFVPVYHPGALSAADASTIVLGPAEERSGVDVSLRLVPTASVFGTVTAPDGSPLVNVQVSLLPLPRSASAGVSRATRSNLDGEYSIAGVPPGRYEVQGSAYPDAFFGSTEILIDGRDVPLSLVLPPSMTVSGRIVFEGATQHPVPGGSMLLLSRQLFAASSTSYQIKEDGTFVFSRVAPGAYRLNINGRPPAGWVVRSVMLNGADVSDVTFEIKSGENIDGIVITLTDRPTEISGVLQTAEGAPAPDYVLVVFSADPRFRVARSRRTQHVRPDINGRFIIRDLPAGDYLISAVTDLEDGQWNDPVFLKELAASAPIKLSVAEGEKKVQDIRIGRFADEVSGTIPDAGRARDSTSKPATPAASSPASQSPPPRQWRQ